MTALCQRPELHVKCHYMKIKVNFCSAPFFPVFTCNANVSWT